MQITLMRHGKPMLAARRWIAPRELGRWIADYDLAEVAPGAIPAASLQAARVATVVFASTLPRAQSSARALGHPAPRIDALFSEATLPFALWRFPRLPAPVWAAWFRLCWFAGYARGADSVAAARTRAGLAASQLVASASAGPVLLIGHGVMNRLIARELAAAGWVATTRQGSGYWHAVTYRHSS